MNIKMTINSQVSKTESKKQKQTKQTRTGTESKKWRPVGGLSVGRGRERTGKMVQGFRRTVGQVQNSRGMLRTV